MKNRKTRRHKQRQKKIIIVSCLSLLLFLCAGYAAFSTNLNIKAKGNIKEQTRVIQSWSSTDQTDFHSDFYKENIVSATFVDNNNVPNNATESWNVSEDKENGIVMAWVVPSSSDNTKYDLYIGARGGVIANKDSSWLFNKFVNLKIITFGANFDTTNTLNMSFMLSRCTNLTTIDLASLNTSNVVNMAWLFEVDTSLQTLDLSNFDTSNVQNMTGIFNECSGLQALDLSNFNTSNATNMQSLFFNCKSLTQLDVSNFVTSNVTNMSWMFHGVNVANLDLSKFNTSNVTNMSGMFNDMENITNLDLCSFNTSRATDMSDMFALSNNLKNVYVGPNWTVKNADTTRMFLGSGISSVTTGKC